LKGKEQTTLIELKIRKRIYITIDYAD